MELLLPLALFAVLYVFLIMPQRKKQRAQQDLMSSLGPGDEVVTGGGLYGGITEVERDVVYLEIAPDVEIKVARRAIAERVFQANPPAPAAPSPAAKGWRGLRPAKADAPVTAGESAVDAEVLDADEVQDLGGSEKNKN